MTMLGVLDVSREESTFQIDRPKPVLPRGGEVGVEYASDKVTRSVDLPGLRAGVLSSLRLSLDAARRQVATSRNSTTLAHLAQALAAVGDIDEARATAKDVLAICGELPGADQWAARVALQVLVQLDSIEEALSYARVLNPDASTALMLGTALAEQGRLGEAREFIVDVDAAEKDAVLAFILVSEEQDAAAVPLLRSALQRVPDDADSAHNLSIAFGRLGSGRKALAAALRATRVAPGRQDLSLHYMELLLEDNAYLKAKREVERLLGLGVKATARLLVVQARAELGLGDFSRCEALLMRAGGIAKSEEDAAVEAEVFSNLARLRVVHKNADREQAIRQLVQLHERFPQSEVVVGNHARVANRRHHAAALEQAFETLADEPREAEAAYIRFHLATLRGHNAEAAEWAQRWFEVEPSSPFAYSAILTALGIGMEKWEEAASIAMTAIDQGVQDAATLNNAAYVLAMAGAAEVAIDLIKTRVAGDPAMQATLGLAYLADGDVDTGMRLYREAANSADGRGGVFRSLMTAYQALVVRQLGVIEVSASKLQATALPSVDLPDDWRDRPEFLRLRYVADRHNYGWPISI